MIHIQHLSPAQIKTQLNINYSDFGMFIKKCLGIELKSVKDAVINTKIQKGVRSTSTKQIYKKECNFNFDPYLYKNIPGYTLLIERGMYHPINNTTGVCRDHIVSKEYGWRNNIDPKIIANPHNCQFITNIENISKGDKSYLTIEELMLRIHNNDFCLVTDNYNHRKLPKTSEHRKKISETTFLSITITNGIENKRIRKTEQIPEGYRIGITHKKKICSSGQIRTDT